MSKAQQIQETKKAPKGPFYVMIKYKNNPEATKLFVKSTSPKKLEMYLKNHLHLWENAHLADSITGEIYHYYHPKQYQMAGDQHRLTKEQYSRFYTAQNYLLCIIHTTRYKRRINDYRYKGAIVKSLEEVPDYWNKNVLRIDIRIGKQLINSYDENGFRHAISS